MELGSPSPCKKRKINEDFEPIPFHSRRSTSTSIDQQKKQIPSSPIAASAEGESFDKVDIMNSNPIPTAPTEAASAATGAYLLQNDIKRTRLDHDNFFLDLFDDIEDANDDDHQPEASDAQISKLVERLNVNGVERSRGALDVHGIHDSSDGGLVVIDRDGTDQTNEFLDHMKSCIYEIINTRPNGGLAKAMSIDKDYVMAQRILFLRSSPSPTLRKADEKVSNDGPSPSLQSNQSEPGKTEGPNDLVSRIDEYFELKYKYFGDHCLARDIAYSDLTAEDRRLWKTGYNQVLSEKDSAGRLVTVGFPQLQHEVGMETRIRVYMYIYQTLSKDLDAQKNGFVHVTYGAGSPSLTELFQSKIAGRVSDFTKVLNSLPLRCRARHMLHSHENFTPIIDHLTEEWDIYHICRYREHFVSSHEEALQILQTFGVPRDAVPVCPVKTEGTKAGDGEISIDGVVLLDDNFVRQSSSVDDTDNNKKKHPRYYLETDFHLGFVEALQKHEEKDHRPMHGKHMHQLNNERSMESSNDQKALKVKEQVPKAPQATVTDSDICMIAPGPMDIELGRGAIYQNRTKPGYLRYRFILDDEFERYEKTDRHNRADVVSSIIRRLNDAGLRFVRPLHRNGMKDDDTTNTTTATTSDGRSRPPVVSWEVASPSVVRDKITHDFRNQRKAMDS